MLLPLPQEGVRIVKRADKRRGKIGDFFTYKLQMETYIKEKEAKQPSKRKMKILKKEKETESTEKETKKSLWRHVLQFTLLQF